MNIEQTIEALEVVFGRFRSEDAIEEAELRAAESRLGIKLPHALRALYARTGRHPLHSAVDRLVLLSELEIVDGFLVFYEESQDVTAWAVERFHEADPPVSTEVKFSDGLRFVPEFATVADFFGLEAAQQATSGALPVCGLVRPGRASSRTSRDAVRAAFEEPTTRVLTSTNAAEARYTDGAICLVSDGHFGLAAQDLARFDALARRLGLGPDDWSYYSPRDR